MEMEMDQSLDDEQSLSEEDAAMGEAPVRGVERASAEHDNTVSLEQAVHRPAIDMLSMEIFGVGSALDCGSSNAAQTAVALRRQSDAAPEVFGVESSANLFPHLRRALEHRWTLIAERERCNNAQKGTAAGGTPLHRTVDGDQPSQNAQQAQAARTSVVPPTPSEVLTVSSIRMMLGMASTFRRSNPAVLQVMCGTLLDLLLETPTLVLAPLHGIPSSIEATTFRRVGDFCAELVGSTDQAERTPALGLYLALAISRGEVSGLLEVVTCLLNCDRKAPLDVRRVSGDSEDGERPPRASSPGGAPPGSTAGAAEPEQGRASELWDAKVSAVLNRLSNHQVNLHLSFPDECEGVMVIVRAPRVSREGSTVNRSPSGIRTSDQDIEWDCPLSAATDGKYVFAWHPDIGLLKAGTGLGGTISGRVYAQNSEAGCCDVSKEGKTTRESFVAVIGDVVYLQTGCFTPPHRFLLAKASNLKVQGTVDATGLLFPDPAPQPAVLEEGVGCPGADDAKILGGAAWTENVQPTPGAAGEDSEPYVPLCCDGQLMYAIVPAEVTGRPSVVAMDVANTGRVMGPAVELQCPSPSIGGTSTRDADKPSLSTGHPAGEGERCVDSPGRISGTRGKPVSDNSPREWPWWRPGKGAKRRVRMYCNGNNLVVGWVHDAGVTAATEDPATPWNHESARGESGLGGPFPGPTNATGADDDTVVKKTRMVRFKLSTGECERVVVNNNFLSGVSNPSTPWIAYDSASNLILKCGLRRLPPSTSPSPQRDHLTLLSEVEMCVGLLENCGLKPGALPGGQYDWREALRAPTEGLGSASCNRSVGHHVPALRETAVFVLAHLDRLGAHYSGWKGGRTHAARKGPIFPAQEGARLSVPFCYDSSTSTFEHLVGLLEIFAQSTAAAVQGRNEEKGAGARVSDESVGVYVLCASLRLLNVNVGILLGHGLGVAEFGGEGLRQSLLRCLLDLIRRCDTNWIRSHSPSRTKSRPRDGVQAGGVAVAREALRLLVNRVDLFYPSRGRQARLLSSYLRVYVSSSESHTTASRAVMLELLRRTSLLPFLRSLLATVGEQSETSGVPAEEEFLLEPSVAPCSSRTPETAKTFSEALLEVSSVQSIKDVRQAAGKDTALDFVVVQGKENGLLRDPSSDSAKQVGLAVLGSLGAVLKLRCVDTFGAAREERSGVVGSTAEFRTFLLLVLQAANKVLAATIETQRSTSKAGVLEKVTEALRNGLVGLLLPRCLASAVVLLEKGGGDGVGPGVADLLSQVIRKLRMLTLPVQNLRRLEERSLSSTPMEHQVEMLRAGFGVAARGQEGRGSAIGAGATGGHQPKEKQQCGEARPSAESAPLPNLLTTTLWLARIERLCASLGASMIRRLVMGVPRTSQEEVNAQWLTHPLLLHAEVGFGCQELDNQEETMAVDDGDTTLPPLSEAGRVPSGLETPPRSRGEGHGCAGASVSPYTFVQQLCCRPASRESCALAAAMKRVVLEDRGGDRHTNEAVWAVSVAAIHHVGVAGDAAAVARAELAGRGPSAAGTSKTKNATVGAPVNPSPALVRAWRSAQQARAQLHSESTSDRRALLIRRAYFLLFLKPWVSTSRGEGFATESRRELDVARALRTSELVLNCLLSPAGTANNTQNSGGSDVVGVVNDDGTREGDLDALLRIIQVQSVRATARTRGLSLAVRLLDGAGSDHAVAQTLRAVTDGLQAGCPRPKPNSHEGNRARQVVENVNTEVLLGEENGEGEPGAGRLHFMPGVECCDPESKSALVESMAGFLRQCSVILEQDRSGDRGAAGNSLTRVPVLVHALRAVSMDYEWNDHEILYRSQLLPLVSRLVHDADRSVAAAASNAVQAVYRCAVPEHRLRYSSPSLDQHAPCGGNAAGGGVAGLSGVGGDDASRPTRRRGEPDNRRASRSTPFQKAFFGAVRRELQHVAGVIGKETQAVVDQELLTSSTAPMLVDEVDTVAADPRAVDIDSKGTESSGCASCGDKLLVGEKEGSTTTTATLAAAQVLALVHACCGVECGRQEFSTVGAVHALLRLILLADSEVRGWALRVCAATLPWVEPSLVDRVFRSIVRERHPSFDGSFVETILLLIGKISGVWGRLGDASGTGGHPDALSVAQTGDCMLDMLLAPSRCRAPRARLSAREAFSVSSGLVSLLHDLVAETEAGGAESAMENKEGLASSSSAWQEGVTTVIRRWLRRAGPVVDSLQRQKALEEQNLWVEAEVARKQRVAGGRQGMDATSAARENGHAKSGPLGELSVAELRARGKDQRDESVQDSIGQSLGGASDLGGAPLGAVAVDSLDCVVAVLCLLGGQVEGLHPGAKVLCRLPPEQRPSNALSGWEDNPTVEATVLRLVPSGPKPPRGDVGRLNKDVGSSSDDPPVDDTPASRETRVESSEAPQQVAVQAARPVFSSRLVLSPPGCNRPMGIYEGLSGDAVATAASDFLRPDPDRLLQLQQLAQQRQDIALRVENARFGMVNRRHGHGGGREGTGRECRTPIVREPDNSLPSGGGGGGCVSAPSTPQQQRQQQQQPVSACKESVTVGVSREDRASTPHAVTVSIDRVTLVRKGVPQVLMKTLTPHVEEFLPGLKAMLGAETEFQGPTYAPLRSRSDCSCVVESTHPYEQGEHSMWPISLKGPETIEVSFDPMSHVTHPEDHIALSWRTPSGGSRHRRISPCSPTTSNVISNLKPSASDGGGSQVWPGVGAEPPLIITTDELTVRFVSAAGAAAAGGVEAASGGEEQDKRLAREATTASPAWGFRLTARGQEVPPKSPPDQPPSQARAALCDLRARTSMSLVALLEHGEMSAGLATVVPVMAKAALRAASEVAVAGGNGDVSSVASEPAQLERRLSRAYDLLHEQPKPPTRLPEADFVQFPLCNGANPPAKSDVDGAVSSATGGGAAHTLATPFTEPFFPGVVVKGADNARGLEGAQRSLKGSGHSVGLCSETWPRRYVVCVGGVWAFDKPVAVTADLSASESRPAARLRHGATVTVVAQERDWLKLVYDPQTIFSPAGDDHHHLSTSPSHVWSRQRQDDTVFLLPEALTTKDIDITAVLDGSGVGESADEGVVVTLPPGEASEEEEEGSLGSLESSSRGGGYGGVGAERGGAPSVEEGAATVHAAGGTENGVIAGAGAGGQRDVQELSGGALWGFTIDTLCAVAARNGVAALLAAAAAAARGHSGIGKPSAVDLFGSVELLWEFLRLTSVVEKGNLQSAAMSALWESVRECVVSEGGGAVGRCLVGHALGTLRGLAAQPGTRATACVFETPHPYKSMMNATWNVHLPGAVRIKIVFDPRSRTKNNSDWVQFWALEDVAVEDSILEVRRRPIYLFGGRRGREDFPGFGGRAPLWLEGDRFVARFQSDSSGTDWGLRFTAYGILGGAASGDSSGGHGVLAAGGTSGSRVAAANTPCDPSKESTRTTVAVAPAPADNDVALARTLAGTAVAGSAAPAGGRAGVVEVELCCWLLERLNGDDGCRAPEVGSRLSDKDALGVFEGCLKAFSQRRRLRVLRLITGVVAKAGVVASFPTGTDENLVHPTAADVRSLLDVVVSLTEAQGAVEGESTPVPPYLQGLVECAVVLRIFLANCDDRSSSPRPEICEAVTPSRAARGSDETDGQVERGRELASGAAATDGSAAQGSSGALGRRLLTRGRGAAAVQEVAAVWPALYDFSRGTTPLHMLSKMFLPILTEACSVTVQSSHPSDPPPAQHRVVVVPGAVGMRVRFDHRTEMREDDRIVIRDLGRCGDPVAGSPMVPETPRQDGSSVVSSGTETETLATGCCNLLRAEGEVSILGLVGGTEEDLPPVSVGDSVVRGPDWAFGDEDHSGGGRQEHPGAEAASSCGGGPGVGVVIALEKWGEREGAGARVRWAGGGGGGAVGAADAETTTKEETGKRFEALYSVQNPAHIRVVKRGGEDLARRPVVTTGNAVEVEFGCVGREPDEAGGKSSRQGRCSHLLRFDGKSTHVDLPSYRGMRLEGDFTLEVWAWLDSGVARNGKRKCVFSRSLQQPFHQKSRRAPHAATAGRRPSSGNDTAEPIPPGLNAAAGSPPAAVGGPPSTRAEQAGFDAAALEDWSWPSPPQEKAPASCQGRVQVAVGDASAPMILRGSAAGAAAAVGGGETLPPSGGVSPMEGTRLVSSPPAMTAGSSADDRRGEAEDGPTREEGRRQQQQHRVVEWEWVGTGTTTRAETKTRLLAAAGLFTDSGSSSSAPPPQQQQQQQQPLLSLDGYRGDGEEGEEERDLCGEEGFFVEEEDAVEDAAEEEEEKEEKGDKDRRGITKGRRNPPVAAAGAGKVTLDGGASEGAPASLQSPPGAVTSADAFLGLRVNRDPHWSGDQQDGDISMVGTVVGTRGLDGACPADGDNPSRDGWTKVRWDNGRVNSYETGANGKYSICFEDAIPGAPQDLAVDSVTDRSINIRWFPPARRGRPALQSYVIYRDEVEIASVGAGTLQFTNTCRTQGWPYSYSVAARGPAGTSPPCPPAAAVTSTEHDRRTQLALWVGGGGEIEFAMGNEREKGVTLRAGQFQEGVWTHLAVSVEGRKVSMFVDGERRASGSFVGRRLISCSPSPVLCELPQQQQQQQQQQGRWPNAEPLRLGSWGAQEFWQGRLRGMTVWGEASHAADIRRRISSPPSTSLVRPAPLSSFGVTLPVFQQGFRRFRLHAPLPDSPETAAVADSAHGGPGRKAYYEVTLRSGGCMQIGWALPSSCPSSRNLGVGDDYHSWAVDGMRSMKWHGNTSPVSSPFAHGVPYGRDWKWKAGDVVGCAVDLDAGVMSFSHNGRSLGKAFSRVRSRSTGRYRVIAPNGVECREGVDARSRVVEVYPPGTVLNVSQAENLSPIGTWRLRTAEGWMDERNVDDPDEFYVERLERDTCDFTDDGNGPERCVFVDVLRLAAELTAATGSTGRGRSREGCGWLASPHGTCRDIVVRECYAEVVVCAEGLADGYGVGEEMFTIAEAAAQALATPPRPPPGGGSRQEATAGRDVLSPSGERDGTLINVSCRATERQRPTRSLLTRGVEVGDADAVTFFVDLFVPAGAGAAGAVGELQWAWGVVVADISVYLTTRCRSTNTNSGDGGGDCSGEGAVAPGHEFAEGQDDDGGQTKDGGGLLHVVVDGPGGLFHALPVCAAFRGRWMTLRIVAHRSGECLLTCTPGTEQVVDHELPNVDGATRPRPGVDEGKSDSLSAEERARQQQQRRRRQQVRCRFSNTRFFRGNRIGSVGLYSERSTRPVLNSRGGGGGGGGNCGFPFLARHAVILLGSLEEQPPPALPRLWQLQRLVFTEQARRRAEPTSRPLLMFSRRLYQLWSEEVQVSAASSTTTKSTVRAGCPTNDAVTAVEGSPPNMRRNAVTPRLTVWQALPSPGRVAFGTTVCLSRRSGTGTNPSSIHGSDENGGRGKIRSLTAREHPALQTPARFEAVPLPNAMSSAADDGRRLWAWAPVPRSEAFLAIGLVFTAGPEPPSLTDVRCVRKDLVVDAEPEECKVVTIERTMPLKGDNRGVEGKDLCCRELVFVKEMGVCVPEEGLMWGLSPRVVLGDTRASLDRSQPWWDDLMPSISGMAGQRMLVNLGHSPFRHSVDGYLPVSEMAHADARFVLQVYDNTSKMWQDVRPGHGLTTVSVPPRAPELIGRWMLHASGDTPGTTTNGGRVIANDVFIDAADASPPTDGASGERRLVRLPPARADGKLEASLGGPPARTLEGAGEGAREMWGYSLRVNPVFPSESGSAHPWLTQRFEAFTALVWGEQGHAHASNIELVRYVNAVALRKGLSKEELLSCDWAALQASGTKLADWPLLQSLESQPTRLRAGRATTASLVSRETKVTTFSASPSTLSAGGGAEEMKQSDRPSDTRQDGAGVVDVCGGRDEWVVSTPNAPAGGVRVRQTPVDNGKVIWRLFPGQLARLLPPPGGKPTDGNSTSQAGGTGWRSVRGVGGEKGWLNLPILDASGGPESAPALERVLADRCVLNWFSSEAVRGAGGEGSDSGVEARARIDSSVAEDPFWLSMRQRGSIATPVDGVEAAGALSPLSSVDLHGDSDALLVTTVDAGAPTDVGGDKGNDDSRPLLVTGKWTVGLVTDTLTVTTRTSGCTRVVGPSVPADRNVPVALSNPDGSSAKGEGDKVVEPLPVLLDGLVFGFRAVDGLLIVTRAFPKASGEKESGTVHMEPVDRQAMAWLGGVNEGTEVSFSIVDNGQDVMFSCREVGSRRRSATVRARCGDTWGRGRVALGARRAAAEDATSGWVRVTSQAHGATVRSGMSIDVDAVVGRIPCGTVVPYDSAIVYHSPGAPDRGGIDPVVRYRCMATVTTPAGWISERGRYADHPYRICEQVRARPQQPPATVSHVSIARVHSPVIIAGSKTSTEGCDSSNGGTGRGTIQGEEPQERRESEWQQRLDELAVLPIRFQLVQQLNRGVSQALRYANLSRGDLSWSMAGLLSRCRHLLFSTLKQELWQAELKRTSRPRVARAGEEGTPPSLELRLSRGRAARHGHSSARETRQPGREGRQTLFGQAFFALRHVQAKVFRLRPEEVLYSTVFLGEHAHDAGGPYRESFAEYCAELQSDALPLLIKCANSVNDVGINREKWLPNPAVGKLGLSAGLHTEMLGFLGRLMGVAVRSQEPLDLDLPSIVWKQLVRSPMTRHDLEAIDLALIQSLISIRDIHNGGLLTEETFRDMGLGGFEVVTADGRRVDLPTPGGASREVTQDNRLEFADMVEAFKMREYRVPVEAIRRGLASVVPIDHLRLFSWDELEVFVCGRKEVDIDLLEACTEYSLCCRQDSHVSAFWDVLRSFSPKEKSLFLRFAWGRSRLPLSAEQFHQPFKIQAFTRAPADAYLPVAHTCFFSLELPRYSSQQVLKEKLRYAIYHCRAVDTDDTSTGRNAAGLGWGGDP